MDDFKSALKEHYKKTTLSDLQYKELKLASESHKNQRKEPPYKWMLVAAAAVVFVAAWWMQPPRDLVTLSRIGSEIAYNHNKQMNPEITSGNYSDVSNFLKKLEFTLIQSEKFKPGVWKLIGGRYCSLSGRVAAQLKMEHVPSGEIYTFYQAPVPDRVSAEVVAGGEVYKSGSHIDVWLEKGLLLGLAGPKDVL